jgi:hypothetical protein
MAFGDLTTVADVKAWLQTTPGQFPSIDDDLLTRLITAASQFIQVRLGHQIASADYLEVRDGTGGERLQFGMFPVSAVLSLSIDDRPIPPAPDTMTAGFSFTPTQLIVRGYCFTRRKQNVIVSYTAGYPTVPPDLAQACIELVALRYRERTRIGEVSKHMGAETVTYWQKDVTASISAVIDQYRMVTPIGGCVPSLAPTQTDALLVAAAL